MRLPYRLTTACTFAQRTRAAVTLSRTAAPGAHGTVKVPQPAPLTLEEFSFGPIVDVSTQLRFLTGPAQLAVDRSGKLKPVISGTSDLGSPTETAVIADGVPYRVVQVRREVVNDVIEHAFLQDLSQVHVYPGAVIQGRSLLAGDVAPIPLARESGTVNVVTDLVTASPGRQSSMVESATEENINHARRQLLQQLSPQDSPGFLKTEFQRAHTYREVGAKLGISVKGAGFGVDANATIDASMRTSTVVAVIRQVYYTTTFAPPKAGAPGIWPDAVSAEDLIRHYCGSGNPPLYIDSVQYGRFICVTVHGAHSSNTLAAALKARWSASVSGNASLDANSKDVLESSEARIYTAGVPGGGQFQRLGDPIGDLDKVFQSGLKFSLSNPGAPISFTCRHVLDNSLAHVGLAASYVQPLEAVGQDFSGEFSVWDGPGGGLVDTGVTVAPGDRALVHAWGQVWSGVALTGPHGPEGWPGRRAHSAAPHPGATANCLIMRVGHGAWIEAQSHWEGTIGPPGTSQAGHLQLHINDNNPYNGDPRKRWQVRVEVKRKSAAAAGVFV
jgi:hypothetical protein